MKKKQQKKKKGINRHSGIKKAFPYIKFKN